MRRSHVVVSLLVMAMIVGACGKSTKKVSTATTAASTATTAAGTATTAGAAAQPTGTTLSVADNASLGKKIIVDAAGKTVYLYMPDGSSKTSTVSASIKANWPPVRPPGGAQTVSSELDSTKLQTDMQADGSSQLAYNGHLLYYFVGDAAAGDAKGNGLGSVWYALGANGDKIG